MSAIIHISPLSFPWQTKDPFLFCTFHEDTYPPGNTDLGPDPTLLTGRNLGQDFQSKDGFRMYHGTVVPGFPAHPHRGFETVTIAQKGLVDHSDSLGAAGRFGNGDVQWMTAGKGVQHCEMFPLLNTSKNNPLLMFQIWINLPKVKKMCAPHFSMLWSEEIPKYIHHDDQNKKTEVTVIAGTLFDTRGLPPAPDSWANDPENGVCIWTLEMEPGAQWILPAHGADLSRTLYYFQGKDVELENKKLLPNHAIEMVSDQSLRITNGPEVSHFLLLQGKPIDEPIAQYGPFVMNHQSEIQETMREYQLTQFGGWPWSKPDHTHAHTSGRFAKYANGKIETR